MAQESVYIQAILKQMGQKQPATPIQTDNSTAEGVINSKIQPKQTKAKLCNSTGYTIARLGNNFYYFGKQANQILPITG